MSTNISKYVNIPTTLDSDPSILEWQKFAAERKRQGKQVYLEMPADAEMRVRLLTELKKNMSQQTKSASKITPSPAKPAAKKPASESVSKFVSIPSFVTETAKKPSSPIRHDSIDLTKRVK